VNWLASYDMIGLAVGREHGFRRPSMENFRDWRVRGSVRKAPTKQTGRKTRIHI
jgi:hypothetical protein